jgi:predicted deacylase
MGEIKLPIEGKLPTRWEIYYYTFMGNIYYWFKILRGNRNINNKTVNQKVEVDIIKDIPGADISKNHEIMNYLFENDLNRVIIDSAKKGTPLIKLGDGSKPRVMITAGVHGNELPPQIAALKLINELDKTNLNGTVYVIPFTCPAASAGNSKLFEGENLNLVADKPGSATNHVLEIAKKLEITSLADFHATSIHPAKDSVIYFLSVASSKIAVYVNKKTNSELMAHIYNPGTLIAACNNNHIPTILCEVESADGIASNESIEVSYNQMKAFLEYNSIIS